MSKVELNVPSAPVVVTNKKLAVLSCILSIIAGLASWGLLKAIHPAFTVPPEYEIGMGASNEARLALIAQQAWADRLNATVAFAIGGSLLCAVLSVTAFSCCALPLRIVIAIAWGAGWGALTGFVGSIAYPALMPSDSLPNTTNTGLAQAVVFAVLGLGAGMLFGGFSRNTTKIGKSMILGGVAGAAGGMLFPIFSGVIMPNQAITGLLQTSTAGALWLTIPFAAIGYALPALSDE